MFTCVTVCWGGFTFSLLVLCDSGLRLAQVFCAHSCRDCQLRMDWSNMEGVCAEWSRWEVESAERELVLLVSGSLWGLRLQLGLLDWNTTDTV